LSTTLLFSPFPTGGINRVYHLRIVWIGFRATRYRYIRTNFRNAVVYRVLTLQEFVPNPSHTVTTCTEDK
jgi:hypothetical protein